MNLVERIKGILLQPKSEWPAIEREPGDAGYLFPNYVAIVAAIPAVIFYNKYSADSAQISHRLEAFADEFAAIVSRQIDVRT